MSGITSIRVSMDMRDKLTDLKVHPKESYEDVIRRLVETAVDNEPLSDATIKGIEESLADIKAGRVRSLEEVAEELGLN
jgi:predicted transcriptional regulator